MKRLFLILICVLLLSQFLIGAEAPVSGEKFEEWVELQNLPFQDTLSVILPELEGFFVTGPLDPFIELDNGVAYKNVRIVASDIYGFTKAKAIIGREFTGTRELKRYNPHCGEVAVEIVFGDDSHTVILTTIQQVRYLIWLRRNIEKGWMDEPNSRRESYNFAVCSYLASVDSGFVQDDPPSVEDFGIAPRFDIYAEPPDYVIQGYQNYKDFLYSHADIEIDFAHGIYAFIPTDSTLAVFKNSALREAYPNKEAAMLQEEYRKFFERGGSVSTINTLSSMGYDTLTTGEYFFAVGLSGKIRFGRELLREEVDRIEKQTGKKVPRANHAFLFPGEPVLCAGAFFIDTDSENQLVKVNAQSGHYFYSNVNESIREDISERSDIYFYSIGHFLRALDRLGIQYENILLSKLY